MKNAIIPLKGEITYGPVDSRRLGRSLGLNVLSPRSKFCPLDCAYCQYGHTRIHRLSSTENMGLPSVAEIEEALIRTLERIEPPEYITLSGNGEPTLHPDLFEIVSVMCLVRDRFAPDAKTAVLSNSATVTNPGVRKALEMLDVRIMKLDAGTPEVFHRFNAPCPGVEFERVVEGLSTLREVTVQTLFAGGARGNFAEDNIEPWIDCLQKIGPIAVQIYSLDRGTLSKKITKVGLRDLQKLSNRLERLGINAKAYAREPS